MHGEMQIRATWSAHAVGGALQPISLVAQRVDNNNFVRAELWESANHTVSIHLIRTSNGATSYLASTTLSNFALGDWWYLRFRFDGTSLSARAWKMGTTQPTAWQVNATLPYASSGTIAVRSSNSVSSSRPVVSIDDFKVQTLGMTIHARVRFRANQAASTVYVLGKGDNSGGGGNREYHLRYHADTKDLKFYVFNPEGGLGAGINFPNVLPERWYSVMMMMDPGDALDTQAGVSMYVDGQLIGSAPDPGAKYGESAWSIYPRSGNADVRIGTTDKDVYFAGDVDEFAILPRKWPAFVALALHNEAVNEPL